MKLLHATVAVALARLAVATFAVAQVQPEAATAERIVPPRFELGTTAGLTLGFPELGFVASLPAGARASVEVGVSYAPRHWEWPTHQIAQVQFRVPFREHLRSRRSLTIGVTRIAASDDGHKFLGSDAPEVFPHGGVSLQWPLSRHADFRFDGQGLITFSSEPLLVPRATVALVWHPGWQANSWRSQR